MPVQKTKTAAIFLTLVSSGCLLAQQSELVLYVGSYTKSCENQGISVFRFDPENAEATPVHTVRSPNPSFLALSRDGQYLYAVNENGNGAVAAFTLDETRKPVFLNKAETAGADPCQLIADDSHIMVANYASGSIAVFERYPDGSVSKIRQLLAHSGKGPNADRQEKPHVHQLTFSPDHKFVLAADLGTDAVYVYEYHKNEPHGILALKGRIAVKPGSGPRHLAFGKQGKFVYLLHELDGTLTVFSHAEGKLEKIQETTVVSAGFEGKIGAADIHVSEDGKFLYATNRGDANTISTFSISEEGKIAFVEMVPSGGKEPRNFVVAPGGRFALVANQKSDAIAIFSRNTKTGRLADTGKRIDICAPACLLFE
jgi:6-phosphogluconolactonase